MSTFLLKRGFVTEMSIHKPEICNPLKIWGKKHGGVPSEDAENCQVFTKYGFFPLIFLGIKHLYENWRKKKKQHDCTCVYGSWTLYGYTVLHFSQQTRSQVWAPHGAEIFSMVKVLDCTAFHYHLPTIILTWRKYCWKGHKIASHPFIHPSEYSICYINLINTLVPYLKVNLWGMTDSIP